MVQSSSDDIVIHYVLPVLRMMSCFHTMGPMGQNHAWRNHNAKKKFVVPVERVWMSSSECDIGRGEICCLWLPCFNLITDKFCFFVTLWYLCPASTISHLMVGEMMKSSEWLSCVLCGMATEKFGSILWNLPYTYHMILNTRHSTFDQNFIKSSFIIRFPMKFSQNKVCTFLPNLKCVTATLCET